MPSSESARFFDQDWSITIPSLPEVKYIKLTAARMSSWQIVASNPANYPYRPQKEPKEAAEDLEKSKQVVLGRYARAKIEQNALEILVQLNGEVVGYAGCFEFEKEPIRLANLGLVLNPETRGKGIGKTTFALMGRLSLELEIDAVQVATMKANEPMRGLARSLGL